MVSEGKPSEWSLRRPRELKLGPFGPAIYKDRVGRGVPVKEKNWMPFTHDGQLYMTYSIVPHRLFRWGGGRRAARAATPPDASFGAPLSTLYTPMRSPPRLLAATPLPQNELDGRGGAAVCHHQPRAA